jgi:hypothetical protein
MGRARVRTLVVPAPTASLRHSLTSLQMWVDNVLQAGTLEIEASTNLAGWAANFTSATPTNVLFYTDPGASDYLRRLYRAF